MTDDEQRKQVLETEIEELKNKVSNGVQPRRDPTSRDRTDDHKPPWRHPAWRALMFCVVAMFLAVIVSFYSLQVVVDSRDTLRQQNQDLQNQIDCGRVFSSDTAVAQADVLQSLGLSSATVLDALLAIQAGDQAKLEGILAQAPNVVLDQQAKVKVLIEAVKAQRASIETCSPNPDSTAPPPITLVATTAP